MSDRSRYSIIPIGSLHMGFALTISGVIRASGPDMIRLAAWVDAVRAGASEYDAAFIAQAIAARPWPPCRADGALPVDRRARTVGRALQA